MIKVVDSVDRISDLRGNIVQLQSLSIIHVVFTLNASVLCVSDQIDQSWIQIFDYIEQTFDQIKLIWLGFCFY